MRRVGKVGLVWFAVLMMTVDPAKACRWRCFSSCCPPVYCYTPCYSSCGPYYAPPCGCGPTAAPAPPSAPAGAPQPTPARQPAPAVPAPEREALPEMPAPRRAAPPAAPPSPELPETEMPEEPAAAEPPAAAPPSAEVEDLFKESAEKAPAAEPSPEEPAAEPKKKEEKKDDIEDLFKETSHTQSSEAQLAVDATALPEGIEDLFTDPPSEPTSDVVTKPAPRVEPVPAVAQPNAMRVWTDNTGKYRVNARLVSIGKHHVRLLKDTGKYTTVPMDRLSGADLAFVQSLSAGSIASNN